MLSPERGTALLSSLTPAPDVATLGTFIHGAFTEQRQFLAKAVASPKPPATAIVRLGKWWR